MPVTIRVKNFQSIKDAQVVVDRFTVVTGTNNSGKTALQRAIRGVFQNTGGTAFIREGEKQCSVEVDFGEDGKVVWSKGLGKRDRPTYVINDGDPIYPGSAVPEEVAAFGVVPIQAGGQDEWPTIAPQFTGQVFLLDRPGSALAEAVADVERVGQLNRALRASEKDKRQASAALKVRQSDLVKHDEAAKSFEGLDDAVEAVDGLAAKRNGCVTLYRAVTGLIGLRDRLKTARKDADKLAPVVDIDVPDAAGCKKLKARLDDLGGLQQRLVDAKAEEVKYKGIRDVLVAVDESIPKRVLAALDVLAGLQGRLRKAEQGLVSRQDELEQSEQDLIEAMSAADELLVEIGVCPTCGTNFRAKV